MARWVTVARIGRGGTAGAWGAGRVLLVRTAHRTAASARNCFHELGLRRDAFWRLGDRSVFRHDAGKLGIALATRRPTSSKTGRELPGTAGRDFGNASGEVGVAAVRPGLV